MTVAALFVDPAGVYSDLPGVDCWGEERDARLYAGPFPVVAHPPCNRWSVLAFCRPELKVGDDGGCFESALRSVRTYGGVLEHPAHTRAWSAFGLPYPPRSGWGSALGEDGWVCQVDQSFYGHPARKITWLYCCGTDTPPLRWGDGGRRAVSVQNLRHGGQRSKTPPAFRDVLLEMARSARAVAA